MANMIIPTAAELATLTNLVANLLAGSYMHLLTGSVSVNPATTLAYCLAHEASFAGYTAAALTTWASPVIDGSGAASTVSVNGIFQNNSGAAQTVTGMFVTDSGPSNLFGVEAFAGAVTIPAGLGFQDELTYTLISRF